ncbi:MAG: hypothetical protein Q9170_004662 [Blastenia crenularia]
MEEAHERRIREVTERMEAEKREREREEKDKKRKEEKKKLEDLEQQLQKIEQKDPPAPQVAATGNATMAELLKVLETAESAANAALGRRETELQQQLNRINEQLRPEMLDYYDRVMPRVLRYANQRLWSRQLQSLAFVRRTFESDIRSARSQIIDDQITMTVDASRSSLESRFEALTKEMDEMSAKEQTEYDNECQRFVVSSHGSQQALPAPEQAAPEQAWSQYRQIQAGQYQQPGQMQQWQAQQQQQQQGQLQQGQEAGRALQQSFNIYPSQPNYPPWQQYQPYQEQVGRQGFLTVDRGYVEEEYAPQRFLEGPDDEMLD